MKTVRFRLYGDYESLNQGYIADALVDFTGGVADKMLVKQLDKSDEATGKLFRDLQDAIDNKSLATACIQVRGGGGHW